MLDKWIYNWEIEENNQKNYNANYEYIMTIILGSQARH